MKGIGMDNVYQQVKNELIDYKFALMHPRLSRLPIPKV